MAKGREARNGPGRCLRLLASHQRPCSFSRNYGEDQLLKTGIRDRNSQFESERQKLTSKSPNGSYGPRALCSEAK
jgi:hypothetical protein